MSIARPTEYRAHAERARTERETPWQPGDPIDYTAPGCVCAVGGMGRRADCPVHGEHRAEVVR